VRFIDYLGQHWAQPFRTPGGTAANAFSHGLQSHGVNEVQKCKLNQYLIAN
jgi:hypothetical protein